MSTSQIIESVYQQQKSKKVRVTKHNGVLVNGKKFLLGPANGTERSVTDYQIRYRLFGRKYFGGKSAVMDNFTEEDAQALREAGATVFQYHWSDGRVDSLLLAIVGWKRYEDIPFEKTRKELEAELTNDGVMP